MRHPRALLLGTTLTLATCLGASPAAAAEQVGLSSDGVTWQDSLTTPLFVPELRWVPGDRDTATFYVRNRGPSAATMTIDVTAGDADQLLAEDDLEVDVRTGDGAWQRVPNGGTTTALVRDSLAEGATTDVDVRVGFAWLSPNRSQRKELPLSLMVTLVQAGPVGPGPGVDPGGWLPGTGADFPPWMLWLAAVLLGAGGAVLVAACKERADG